MSFLKGLGRFRNIFFVCMAFNLFSLSLSAAIQFQMIKEGMEKAGDAQIWLETLGDLAESAMDENEITKSMSGSSEKMRAIMMEVREAHFTAEEVQDLFQGDSDSTDSIYQLRRLSSRVRRTRDLANRIRLLTHSNPATVAASEQMKANATLNDIALEMYRDHRERKDKEREIALREKLEQKKREKFFKDQFAYMKLHSQKMPVKIMPINTTEISKN